MWTYAKRLYSTARRRRYFEPTRTISCVVSCIRTARTLVLCTLLFSRATAGSFSVTSLRQFCNNGWSGAQCVCLGLYSEMSSIRNVSARRKKAMMLPEGLTPRVNLKGLKAAVPALHDVPAAVPVSFSSQSLRTERPLVGRNTNCTA